MYASVIRPQRYGQPRDAFEVEVVDVPKPGPRQVLTWGARVFAFDQIGQAHQMLHENTHPSGNLAVRVNATDGS